MKIKETMKVWGCTESYIGKKNGYTIGINSLKPNLAKDKSRLWYFVISSSTSIFAYNSNLDGVMFASKEECLKSAETKAKEFDEENFPSEQDNVHRSLTQKLCGNRLTNL